MARLVQKARSSGHKVLIVDDTEEVVDSTRLLLEKEGHAIETATNGPDAVEKVRAWKPHLIVLDYFMPGMTGEEVVAAVRPFDREVQILLQTGYASEKPPREMLLKLEIQGYHDKSEGPEKLLIWVDAGLKAFRQMETIHKSRQGLRHILDAVPEMYNLQTLDDLLRGILHQMDALMGGRSSFVAAVPGALQRGGAEVLSSESFVVTVGDEEELEIVAGTGRFAEVRSVESLEPDLLAHLRECLRDSAVKEDGTHTFVPLRVGSKPLGVVFFDRRSEAGCDVELLRVFAVQASQALENRRLFGMATEDDLTKVFIRTFFNKRLETEIVEATRYEYPLSLIIIDVDRFKQINDTLGHLAGDSLLREISSILRQGVRHHDFVGRFGGDEFVVALPHTDSGTAEAVAEHLRAQVEACSFTNTGTLRPTLSIGVASLLPPRDQKISVRRSQLGRLVTHLMQAADEALYKSKQRGRNCCSAAPSLDLEQVLARLEVEPLGGG